MKIEFKKILITLLYVQSQVAFAQSSFLSDGQNSIMNNQLAFEQCPLVDETYTAFENDIPVVKTRKVEDAACLARNREKAKIRSIAQEGYQRASALNSGNSESISKPTPPPDPQCGNQMDSQTGDYNPNYSLCMQNYQNQQKEYQKQLAIYNTAMDSQQQSRMQADKAQYDELAKMKNTSATGSMSEIQDKNDKSKQLYTLAAAAAAGVAVGWYVKANHCAATCSMMGSGCCGLVPGLMATGAAFMLLNGMANKQSAEHAQAAYSACTAYNQMSTQVKNCSGPNTAVTISSIDPNTGLCKPDAPPECQQGLNQSGIKIPVTKDANGKISKMAGSEIEKMATQLPDGRVKDKNGKIWSLSDFADKKSMMAAGLSAADAGKLFDELYGKNGLLAKNSLLNPKDALKEENSKKNVLGGSFGSSLGGTNIVDVNKNEGSQNKVFKDNLKDVDNRKPSSEGLAREYKGEMIGVAGDDIFLMMNKRYKFKNEQDSFISVEAAH